MKIILVTLAAVGAFTFPLGAEASASICKGKPAKVTVYVYEIKSVKNGETLATTELALHSAQLCNVGGKIELYNKQPVTSGQFGFFCESEKTTDADLWAVDLKARTTLPPAFIGFAFKRCRQGDEAKLQASWIPHKGAEPHPAHEVAFEQDGDINENYTSIWSTFSLAKPNEDKLKGYLAAYQKNANQKAAAGNGWIAGFWNNCFQEQIAAVQEGRAINQSWFPKNGATFSADDGLFSVANVISDNPVRILIEGPAQADNTVANRCYAVLTLKDKSQLQVTQAPTPGYQIKVGDQIHGFTIKALGRATVKIKTARSVASEEKVLPEFQLIGKIPVAQRP